MTQKAIREYDSQRIIVRHMNSMGSGSKLKEDHFVQIAPGTVLSTLPECYPWLNTKKVVVKPDQLLKRRGKAGLVLLNSTWDTALQWLEEKRGQCIEIGRAKGPLTHFVVEPFVPHAQSDEYYVCIQAKRWGEEILFYHEAGVDIGDVDAKAERMVVPLMEEISEQELVMTLLSKVPASRQPALARWVSTLFKVYMLCHFSYLEINPLVMTDDTSIAALDMAAKLDETARFCCRKYWGEVQFPGQFGHTALPEEDFVASLDEKTGASLKLTILNPKGRIWLMVAGGGASVIYSDTVADLGGGPELANYGEYSGDPTADLTYSYASTIIKLMTREPHPDGKCLIIGGGIANFTDVAATFTGIIKALEQYSKAIIEQNVKIYVRRGGPNYQEGLNMMRGLASKLGIFIDVRGPETHMTSVVAMALGKAVATNLGEAEDASASPFQKVAPAPKPVPPAPLKPASPKAAPDDEDTKPLFHQRTRAIVYGMQPAAVQNMLDFDYISRRATPSVVAIVYPFASGLSQRQFYWCSKEIMIPVYHRLRPCLEKFPEVDTVVNFASSRSVYESVLEIMEYPQIRSIAIIAEGVPEKFSRNLCKLSKEKGVTIIGPATVGGVKPGCFRIGNAGGRLDNVVSSKLFRRGSVAYVSRSGGLANELNNILSRVTDGVNEGIAIGGDRFPCTDFMDHMLRYEADPSIQMMVLLGEVGGTLEYDVCEAIKAGTITKPVVAWCTGTVAKFFPYDVQFGHAGALAQATLETADAKNAALRAAGCLVPSSFEEFATLISDAYQARVAEGTISPAEEVEPPPIPVDYSWARKLGLIRKPAAFLSSITDERGEELCYSGMPISKVFSEDIGIGGVLGLLWFRRRLPTYACKFIEVCCAALIPCSWYALMADQVGHVAVSFQLRVCFVFLLVQPPPILTSQRAWWASASRSAGLMYIEEYECSLWQPVHISLATGVTPAQT